MISRLNRRRLVRMAKKILNNRELFENYFEHGTRGMKWGAYNRFIKLTESWGLKVCSFQGERIFRHQRHAWRVGCGPFCFGLMRQNPLYGTGEYAFITEIVKMRAEVDPDYTKKYEKRISHISIKMEKKASFKWTDKHSGNYGFKQSVLVCIDFDELGVSM